MKKYFLVLAVSLFFMSGCMDVSSLQYQPARELAERYDNSAKDDYLTVYYEIKDAQEGRILMMSIKNTGNLFMRNLSVQFDESQLKKLGSYTYKNLGNLKNRSAKEFSIVLPKGDLDSMKLEYSFTPVQEDGFLNRDTPIGHVDVEPITGDITLYLQ
ncbi:MAG: hypothetical protein AB7F25_00715 [Deferribacterales bacterium]